MEAEIVFKYFPEFSDKQKEQIYALGDLYREWNERINVVSRKDIDNLYVHHVLHSLVIAKFLGPLAPGTTMLDLGTGGGFPGVPLAIAYPECRFHLIDRIGKKIRVATEVSQAIGLQNVTMQHGDIGECHGKYDYVVSRAVMPLADLVKCAKKNVKSTSNPDNRYANGIVCLKGGDLQKEMEEVKLPVVDFPIGEILPEQHFSDKYVVYVKGC